MKKKLCITFMPPIAAAMLVLLRNSVISALNHFPKCIFHEMTGLWCPGCGNTRAAKEMLSFHFITAMRYNITLPLTAAVCVFLYIRYVISHWIKPLKPIKAGSRLILAAALIFMLYCVVRNIIDFMPQP